MRRFLVCAWCLVSQACSDGADNGENRSQAALGGKSGGGTTSNSTVGGTNTVAESSSVGGSTTTLGGASLGGGNAVTNTNSGGTDSGVGGAGTKSSSASGSTSNGGSGPRNSAAGNGAGPVVASGGAGSGTKASTRASAGTANSPNSSVARGGAGAAAGSGPKPSAGGATVGGAGGSSGLVTSPIAKDPAAAAAGLPQYYISPKGDDKKSGTSPEEAWATTTNIPKDKAAAVYFEKGGTYKAASAPAIGRDGPSAFNVPKGSVWTAYGSGDKRPILYATEKTANKPTGAVIAPGGNTLLSGLSFTGQANFGVLLMSDSNVVQDCEIDGNIEDSLIQLGISVRGNYNQVVGNYIHSLHVVILDSGNVNTSGGAEAIVVNGTNQEIAYNKIVDCWTPNETLGGAEGGCLEIIARTPGEVVENINFHHNYCERSVGLFEACAGNFAGTSEKIQEHHAVVRNTTLAYNVVVDAMWLYLLQTANTDMDGLVFEHNTLVHGPANTEIPQQGAPGFGNFYDTDVFIPSKSCTANADCGSSYAICLNKSCYYQTKAQPGQITVRNNLFVVLEGATAATMRLPPGPDDVVDNIFAPKAPSGVTAASGKVTVVSDAGLMDSFRLAPTSPAIDKGAKESVKPWIDFDGNSVPCGSSPDVGAIEYCP